MLSKEENELLTRVGPGTLMGDLLRRYWTPACLSSELPGSDSDPIRVRLLGGACRGPCADLRGQAPMRVAEERPVEVGSIHGTQLPSKRGDDFAMNASYARRKSAVCMQIAWASAAASIALSRSIAHS